MWGVCSVLYYLKTIPPMPTSHDAAPRESGLCDDEGADTDTNHYHQRPIFALLPCAPALLSIAVHLATAFAAISHRSF